MPIKVTRLIRPSVAPPPPPPVADTWTNLVVGTPANDGNSYFTRSCLNTLTNKILIPGFQNTTNLFDLAAGTFSPVAGSTWGSTENYMLSFDAVNNRYWITASSPASGTFKVPPYGSQDNSRSGWFSGNDPGLVSGPGSFNWWRFAGSNGMQGIAQGRWLLCAGTFSTDMSNIAVSDLNSIVGTSGGFTLAATGDIPPATESPIGGITLERKCMVDTRTGQIYFVGPEAANGTVTTLYICSGILQGSARWIKMPTFGTAPPSLATNYAFDESANAIVGWTGLDRWVTGSGETTVRKTFVLPLSTLIWRMGPQASLGDTVPPGEVASYGDMMYDPLGLRTLLVLHGAGTGCRVWGLKLGGPTL